MIQPALSEQAGRRGINKACGWNNELELSQHLHIRRSELAQTWDGGIMCYCEFGPGGSGRPTDNPKALARYLKSEQSCLQAEQKPLFCRCDLRLLIIAAFYAPSSTTPQLCSQAYNNVRWVRFNFINTILKVTFQDFTHYKTFLFFLFLNKNNCELGVGKLKSIWYKSPHTISRNIYGYL